MSTLSHKSSKREYQTGAITCGMFRVHSPGGMLSRRVGVCWRQRRDAVITSLWPLLAGACETGTASRDRAPVLLWRHSKCHRQRTQVIELINTLWLIIIVIRQVFIALRTEKIAFIFADEGAKQLHALSTNVEVKKSNKWQSAICTGNYCRESIKNLF